MKQQQLRLLRTFSLLFLLPGLAGLIVSATVSTQYLMTLPRMPVPAEMRMLPRNIHGTVVYQTEREDQRLNILDDSSIVVFLVGLSMGLVYLRKWGLANAINAEEEDLLPDEGK